MENEARTYLECAERKFLTMESWKNKISERAEKYEAKAEQIIESLNFFNLLLNLVSNIFLVIFQVSLGCAAVKHIIWIVGIYILSLGSPMGLAFMKLHKVFRSLEALRLREKMIDNSLLALQVRVELREAHYQHAHAERMPQDINLSESIQMFLDMMGSIDIVRFKWEYYYRLSIIAFFTLGYTAALVALAHFKFCGLHALVTGGGGVMQPIIPFRMP